MKLMGVLIVMVMVWAGGEQDATKRQRSRDSMMHSLTQRVSTWSSTLTTALFTVAMLVSVLTWVGAPGVDDVRSLRVRNVKAQVSVKSTRNYGGTKAKPKENAKLKFDLVADFSDLVDWNTKQVFAYVYIELDDPVSVSRSAAAEQTESKLVIWDKILTEPSQMYINNKNIKSKYSIWDYAPELHGRTGHIKLGYNIQPHIGPLTFAELDLNQTITFPDSMV